MRESSLMQRNHFVHYHRREAARERSSDVDSPSVDEKKRDSNSAFQSVWKLQSLWQVCPDWKQRGLSGKTHFLRL